MSLSPSASIESLLPRAADPDAASIPPSIRRAAMLDHPTLAVAAIEKGRIREINASWHALFALPPDVSVESHVATLFPNVSSADRFEQHLRAERAANRGGALIARSEHTLVRRDGSAFLAELIVWLFDVEDTDHPLNGDAIWQVRDITVERTLRRELRDLEDYHRELSRHQWDMTFVIDRKGRISYVSSSIEGVLGYRANAMLGEPFASLLDPGHAAAAEQWLRATSRREPAEADRRGPEGFTLRVLDDHGDVRALVCRARDCFRIPRIAGLVVHARETDPLPTADDRAKPARSDAVGLRRVLFEFARLPTPTTDADLDAVLETMRSSIDASSVTCWRASGVAREQGWTLHASAIAANDGVSSIEQVGTVPPLMSGLIDSPADDLLIVDDVSDMDSIASGRLAALQASGTAAVIEVPVIAEGKTLGWLAFGASGRRQWLDAEIDFAIGGAFVVMRVFESADAAASAAERAGDDAALRRDALTGLADRAEAERYLAGQIADAVDGESLVALVVDLDRLQDVNDGSGLAAGDAVIKRTAEILFDAAGAGSFVGRVGGDEFLIVVPDADVSEVDALVHSILDRVGNATSGDANEMRIEASIGVARFPVDATDASSLMVQADLAMREAKGRGRGQAFVFNHKLATDLRVRRMLDGEIEEALQRDEFTVFYQPQLSFATGAVVGLEALLRWQHPTRGLLLPDAFIQGAFQRGLVDAITKLVLTQVCEQIAAWRRVGDLPELPVAVNVPGRQFHDRRLPAFVASALLKSGLPARLLVLEITEQSLVGDDVGIERVVKELQRLGVRIAIGDFNLGHASFKYLRQLRVSQVKLASGFVNGLPDDADNAMVVAAVIDISRRLDYQVVAEGVETRQQFEHLRDIGCEVGQGFYFGAPLPAVGIRAFLESNAKRPIR